MIESPLTLLEAHLKRFRFRHGDEKELQAGIESALRRGGWEFEREVRLSATDVVDFLVDETIGLEVKIGGTLSDLTRQLHRYALHERIGSLFVVVGQQRLARLPATLNEKPLGVLSLMRGLL